MQKIIYQLADLPVSRALVIGLVVAGLYWAMFFDNGESILNQQTAVNEQVSTLSDEIRKAKSALQDLKKFEDEMRQLANSYKQIVEFMPQQMNNADLTSLISEQAQSAGTRVIEIKPAEGGGSASSEMTPTGDAGATFYDTFRIEVKLEGKFVSLLTFLAQLSKVPRLLTMDNLELTVVSTGEPETPTLELKGVIVGYRYLIKKGADANDPLGLNAVIDGKAQ